MTDGVDSMAVFHYDVLNWSFGTASADTYAEVRTTTPRGHEVV